jgi:hypothetical protein
MESVAQRMNILGDVATGIAAAGTTAATATTLPAHHCTVTSATQGSAEGVIMKARTPPSFQSVSNKTSVYIKVYPPTGAQFNGAGANVAVQIKPNGGALFFLTATYDLMCIFS